MIVARVIQVQIALLYAQQEKRHLNLERILASGGGLLVVVNQATATDKDLAEQLSTAEIPVVIIEARTLASLQRLGAASPVAHTEVLFEPESLVQQSLVDTQILFAQYG
jgi:hypothetical protein